MKIIFLILKIFTTFHIINCNSLTIEKDNCDQVFSDKSLLQQCCNIPNSINFLSQQNCYARCSHVPLPQMDICAMDCYLMETMLLDPDRKLVKSIAKRIYKSNTYHEASWLGLIDSGVDNCTYEVNDDVEQSLKKFYGCVDNYLISNCVSFLQSPKCEEIEERYDICKEKTVDCTSFPCNLVYIQSCCKTPQLLNPNVMEKCSIDCQMKEILIRKRAECTFNCTYIDTGLLIDGKVSFENSKRILMMNTNSSNEWEKSIDVAIKTCEPRFKDWKITRIDQMQLQQITNCLNEILSNNCVEFRSSSYCRKIQRFMTKCPDAKPSRSSNCYSYGYSQHSYQQYNYQRSPPMPPPQPVGV